MPTIAINIPTRRREAIALWGSDRRQEMRTNTHCHLLRKGFQKVIEL
ncbi:MAG: hypothetical protein J7647_10460 [Cyanobacteria bacterium SBLK]|nr:hypothetical protein [Cyanobacteria bacterium SBLK]